MPEVITKLALVDYLPYSKTDPLVFDRSYRLPTDAEVLDVLGSDYSAFEDEANDCDDYAFRAKRIVAGRSWPFAVCWINGNHLVHKPYAGKIESVNAIIV